MPPPQRTLRPTTNPASRLWYLVGLAAMAAGKLRYALLPYNRPRPFPAADSQAAADYDLSVFQGWCRYLREYLGRPYEWTGKKVLELGPGPDLGTGLLALAAGAELYTAFDKYPLARSTGPALYRRLLDQLPQDLTCQAETKAELLQEVQAALAGSGRRLRYVHRRDFDVSETHLPPADLVLSQAAFEHFDDPQATIAQLSHLTRPGAIFLAVVDLQTHTRWLRDRDPLNIYRYSPRLYRLLRHPGCPNRARAHDYVRYLSQSAWANIQVRPLLVLDKEYLQAVSPRLAESFRSQDAQMECLTIVLGATRTISHS